MDPLPESEMLLQLIVSWEELRKQGKSVTPEELCPGDSRLQSLLRERVARRQRLAAALGLPTVAQIEHIADPPIRPAIEGYEIGELLGRGGMGLVFKAVQTALKRTVALKIVVSGAYAGAKERTRFRTEAEAVAQLHDPGIVQIYEVGEQEGCPYLALEFVGGGSLALQINGTPMSQQRAAQLLLELSHAVQHAHERGIVHRDLKPANILLTPDGTAKITDFGLAKLLHGEESGPTGSGEMLGTPSYMAPEQAAGMPEAIGPATDVYGLGAILYELLTGRPPFKAESALETFRQIRLEDPVSPSRLQPKLSRDLVTICLRCLQKEPRQRYATAQALAEDLQRFLDGRPIRARPLGLGARIIKWARRRPAVAALAMGIFLAVALGFAGITWQWRQAVESRRTAEDRLYFNRIALAHQAWQAHQVGQAERILDECIPNNGQDDKRSWEWHYLKRLCRSAILTFDAHKFTVSGIAFSPDGQLLASCSGEWRGQEPGEVLVWNANTGELVHEFRGHQSTVNAVVFTPDSRLLASSSSDKTVRLWDLAHPNEPAVVIPLEASAWVRLSPDGRLIAAGCSDNAIRIWDANTHTLLRTYRQHPDNVFAVAFHPTERLIASGSRSGGVVRLWNPDTGEDVRALPCDSDVRCIAFSADGNMLAAGSYDGSLKVWDLSRPDAEAITYRLYAGGVLSVAFSPEGHLAWCTTMGRIQVIDPKTGETLQNIRGHDGGVCCLAFSPDGRRLATGGGDHRVHVWDAVAPQEVLAVRRDGGWNYDCAFSPDDRYIALAGGISQSRSGGHKSVRLWDVEHKNWCREFEWKEYLTSVAFGQDQVAAGSEEGPVVVWDFATGAVKHELCGHQGVVTGIAYSPDGRRLVSAGADGSVRWWDPLTGETTHSVSGNGRPMSGVAYSPDGCLVAAAGADAVVRLWDAATGREVHALHGHKAAVSSVAISPDGQWLASADLDQQVRLWHMPTSNAYEPRDASIRLDGWTEVEKRMPWDRGRPLTPRLAFTPDSRRLAAVYGHQPVRFWDVATGLPAINLSFEESNFQCLAFSRNGRWMAAAAGVWLHVWEAQSHAPPTADSQHIPSERAEHSTERTRVR